MAEVSVEVAGRAYRLGCGEGEEEHLIGLAAMLDDEARTLLRQFGQMSEGRLLMMTSLVIADQMAEAEGKARQAEQKLAEAQKLAESRAQPSDMFNPDIEPEREQQIARRLNLLVEQIETAAGADDAPEAEFE